MHMKRVNIPATSGNMGVGFDSIGFAMNLYNSVDFGPSPSGRLLIEQAEGGCHIPCDERNLVYKAALETAAALHKPLPPLHLIQHNRIPLASGLGSSAACIVGGILIASEILGKPLSKEEALKIAARMEGHPDNAAPALYGGITVSKAVLDGYLTINLPVKGDLAVCAATPRIKIKLSTLDSRKALPACYPPADVVNNLGCTALLVSAIYSGDYSLFKTALADRLHQPYRKKFIPGFDDIIARALELGAYGACLSGAGPTMLAFVPEGEKEAFARRLGERFPEKTVEWDVRALSICQKGAHIEEASL